jgi:hypothetical protein
VAQIFYHRTSAEAAAAILANGFVDGEGAYMTDTTLRGVWISDEPLSEGEGASGPAVLELAIAPEVADLAAFAEVIEAEKPYREWCTSAAILNERAAARLLSDAELEEAERRAWSRRFVSLSELE